MVQQLSLFGQITRQQKDLTTTAFSTLTGSPMTSYKTYTMLCSPKTIIKYEPNSKNTQHEQYKLHLKTPYNEESHDRRTYTQWCIQTSDVPSAGKRKTSTQSILESCLTLQQGQALEDVLNSLGYQPEKEFLVRGQRTFYGNVVIEVFQVLIKTEEDGPWKELDEVSLIVKCFINVDKATDVENLQKATQELVNLKNELTGLVELDIPDRNVMDSRIGLRR